MIPIPIFIRHDEGFEQFLQLVVPYIIILATIFILPELSISIIKEQIEISGRTLNPTLMKFTFIGLYVLFYQTAFMLFTTQTDLGKKIIKKLLRK